MVHSFNPPDSCETAGSAVVAKKADVAAKKMETGELEADGIVLKN